MSNCDTYYILLCLLAKSDEYGDISNFRVLKSYLCRRDANMTMGSVLCSLKSQLQKHVISHKQSNVPKLEDTFCHFSRPCISAAVNS
jgi:hypothetical protein